MMGSAMWVIISAILGLAAVLLGVLLWRQQRDNHDLREERDAVGRERDSAVAAKEKAVAERNRARQDATTATAAKPAEQTDPGDDDVRRSYVRAAQEAVNGTVRRMQGLGNDAAERIQGMLHAHGAEVLADLMPIDHVVAQMQRRLQVLAVLCGSWPGQQRSPAELADVVRGAQSRIHDYARVRMSTPEEKTAVVGRVVEPVGMALAELLDNATRSSPPSTLVDVVFETDYHGVSIMVIDGGVGMSPEEVQHAVGLLQWGQHEVDLTELGNPPRTGFAVCGVLSARYGFRVGLDTGSPRGGLRATLFVPSALLTTIDPGEETRVLEAPVRSERAASGKARHSRSAEQDTAVTPAVVKDGASGTEPAVALVGYDGLGYEAPDDEGPAYEGLSYEGLSYEGLSYDGLGYDSGGENGRAKNGSGENGAAENGSGENGTDTGRNGAPQPKPRRAGARDTISSTDPDADAEPALASTPSWPVHDEEPSARTTGGLPKRRRAHRVGRTGHTGELPAVDARDKLALSTATPTPTPRHAQVGTPGESTHTTEVSASNLRSLQNGARRLVESEDADDE